jgi:hypothetical protein
MKTQTKPTSPKLAPITSLQPHSKPTTYFGVRTSNSTNFNNGPHGRPAPKPGQQHQDSTVGPTLSDSEWAEYGKSVHANQQAQARRYREIAELKRQAESLHHSMNVRATPGLVEECSNCHGHHEGAC